MVYSLTFGIPIPRIDVTIIHIHDEHSLVIHEVSLVSISLLAKRGWLKGTLMVCLPTRANTDKLK